MPLGFAGDGAHRVSSGRDSCGIGTATTQAGSVPRPHRAVGQRVQRFPVVKSRLVRSWWRWSGRLPRLRWGAAHREYGMNQSRATVRAGPVGEWGGAGAARRRDPDQRGPGRGWLRQRRGSQGGRFGMGTLGRPRASRPPCWPVPGRAPRRLAKRSATSGAKRLATHATVTGAGLMPPTGPGGPMMRLGREARHPKVMVRRLRDEGRFTQRGATVIVTAALRALCPADSTLTP
jgi:hypothetical protein